MANGPIHKLPSGRWEVRYRDPTGRTRRSRFDTRGAAKDFYADVRTKSRTGGWVAPELGKVTFGKWVDEWWSTTVHLRSATRTRYDRDLRLHIRPRFERAPLAKITPRDVAPGSARCRPAVSLPRACVGVSRCSGRSWVTRSTWR